MKKHDALWATVAAKFEAAILAADGNPEEHAAVFEERNSPTSSSIGLATRTRRGHCHRGGAADGAL